MIVFGLFRVEQVGEGLGRTGHLAAAPAGEVNVLPRGRRGAGLDQLCGPGRGVDGGAGVFFHLAGGVDGGVHHG